MANANANANVARNVKTTTFKGLSGLSQLSGLRVTPSQPEDAELAKIDAAERAVQEQTKAQAQRAKDVVRIHRETKGRGGKAVTLVKGMTLPLSELEALGKQLKTACGSGGTVKDGVIEVQGDHADRLMVILKEQGYQPKKAGF